MDPQVIGLIGGIGSGKGAVSKILQEDYGYEPLSFAAPLKRLVSSVLVPLGAETRHFYGTQEDKSEPIAALGGVTGRRALEIIGSEGFRAAVPDVWPAYTFKVNADPTRSYVIDDVRFPNEADYIRSRGGIIVRVVRAGHTVERTGHQSDAHWPKILPHYRLVCESGALDKLREEVSFIMTMERMSRGRKALEQADDEERQDRPSL